MKDEGPIRKPAARRGPLPLEVKASLPLRPWPMFCNICLVSPLVTFRPIPGAVCEVTAMGPRRPHARGHVDDVSLRAEATCVPRLARLVTLRPLPGAVCEVTAMGPRRPRARGHVDDVSLRAKATACPGLHVS
jgi:hypothetical protein